MASSSTDVGRSRARDIIQRAQILITHVGTVLQHHQAVVPGGEFQVVYNTIPEKENLSGIAKDRAEQGRPLFDKTEWAGKYEDVVHPEDGINASLLSKLTREDGTAVQCDGRRRWQERSLLECITGGVESQKRQKALSEKFLDGRRPLHVYKGCEILTIFSINVLDEDPPEPSACHKIRTCAPCCCSCSC